MMTIDEAIEHAVWCAENSCGECSEEHQQLAEWLKEVRTYDKVKSMTTSLIRELEAKNEKLRDENDRLRDYSQWLEGMVEDGWWDPIVNIQKLFDDKRVELGIEVK